MKLSQFNFDLPPHLVAQYPAEERDEARLMVADRELGTIEHYSFKDLPKFFKEGDALVLNNSKVFPCYLRGYKEKTMANIGVLLLRELDSTHHLWDVWIDPARKIRVGNKLCFNQDLVAEVIDNTTSRGRTIKFSFDGDSDTLRKIFNEIGEPPMPSALNRKAEEMDRERYKTIYAKEPGSVAPPTAGFHFTPYLLKYLEVEGVLLPEVTLHISVDSFKRVEAEELRKYKLHTEFYHIPKETETIVNNALEQERKVCAVGTSTLKALETSLSHTRSLQAGKGWSNKFVNPPYETEIANALITNFHLPRSIDFVNTLAFAGHNFAMEIYAAAIAEKYRFFVYGDALLIL